LGEHADTRDKVDVEDGRFTRAFLWLAGADRTALDNCGERRDAEASKLVALGALVLIPAVLGVASMAFAISTVAPSPFVWFPAGLIWGAMVLAIDRFLVTTAASPGTAGQQRSKLPIISRYVFAIFVGIAVAHPFTMLWFNESLSQQLSANRQTAIAERLQEGDAQRAVVNASAIPNTSAVLVADRAKQVEYKNCLTSLQQFEQSNAGQVSLDCGATTGVPTCAQRCLDISPRIEAAGRDIEALDGRIAEAQRLETEDAQRRQPLLAAIDEQQSTDIARIDDGYSEDYLARVRALSQIEDREPEVLVISTFILLFFVLVDVLPVTMKMTARSTTYEDVRDTSLLRAAAFEHAYREKLTEGSEQRAKAQRDAENAIAMHDVTVMSDFSEQVLGKFIEDRTRFNEGFDRLADPQHQARATEAELSSLERLGREAWEKTMDRVFTFMRTR
jgi:hypothetical protein